MKQYYNTVCQEDIMEEISQGPQTVETLSRRLGYHRSTITKHILHLIERKKILHKSLREGYILRED